MGLIVRWCNCWCPSNMLWMSWWGRGVAKATQCRQDQGMRAQGNIHKLSWEYQNRFSSWLCCTVPHQVLAAVSWRAVCVGMLPVWQRMTRTSQALCSANICSLQALRAPPPPFLHGMDARAWHFPLLLGTKPPLNAVSSNPSALLPVGKAPSSPLVFHDEPNGEANLLVLLIRAVLDLGAQLLLAPLDVLQGVLHQVPHSPVLGGIQGLDVLQDVQDLPNHSKNRFRTCPCSSTTYKHTEIFCWSQL